MDERKPASLPIRAFIKMQIYRPHPSYLHHNLISKRGNHAMHEIPGDAPSPLGYSPSEHTEQLV